MWRPGALTGQNFFEAPGESPNSQPTTGVSRWLVKAILVDTDRVSGRYLGTDAQGDPQLAHASGWTIANRSPKLMAVSLRTQEPRGTNVRVPTGL